MARTQWWRRIAGGSIVGAIIAGSASVPTSASAAPQAHVMRSSCPAIQWPSAGTTQAGHKYVSLAFDALTRDRARFAGLGALRKSLTLSAIAEAHSVYMASIGSWSDGDPSGWILSRVRAAGIEATYAGQNVVTANGPTVAAAVQTGEAFFAREAAGGGPHWDNITNPNHRYVGMGMALLGGPGNYTIYLTQVFSDGGGCGTASPVTFSSASAVSSSPRVGSTAHPSVDALLLHSEPGGSVVIQTLHSRDRVKVITLQGDWAQVEVLSNQLYGWAYSPFLTRS
jgi:uncharacterized protein YkwD